MKKQEEIIGEFRINHPYKTIYCPWDYESIPEEVRGLLMLKGYVLQYEIK